MTSTRHLPLRIDVPTLEPDAATVERLAIAGAASAPSVGTPWMVGVRTALVSFVVALLGATTWAAGALAGVETPFRHPAQSAPLTPTTPTGTAGSPQPGGSPSGSPAPSGLPDTSSRAFGLDEAGAAVARGHHPAPRRIAKHHRTSQHRHHRDHRHGARRGHHHGWSNRRSQH